MWYNPHAMSATPKVSVITAAYKAARYIGQAIESVQAQTLTDWEMIIVDDASPDETAEVVKRYLDDPRIKLIRNEQNAGAGYSRNRAIEAAQGEWIAVLDADDWYAPERLEDLWKLAQEKETLVVADLQLQIDDMGKTYGVVFPHHLKPPTQPTRYTVHEYVYHHIPMKPFANREHIQRHTIRYPEDVVWIEDCIFQVQLLLRGSDLWLLPKPSYLYRVHPASTTSEHGSKLSLRNLLFDRLRELEGVRGNAELIRCVEAARRRCTLPIRYREFMEAVKRRQWRAARQHFGPDVALFVVKRLPTAVYRRLRKHRHAANSGAQ
jgi:succinoglycan biosynthesis protein ExoO